MPVVQHTLTIRYASLVEYGHCSCLCWQVSLAGVGEDKFSRLLQSTHNLVATLLEVSLNYCSVSEVVCVVVGGTSSRCRETCGRADDILHIHFQSGSIRICVVCAAGDCLWHCCSLDMMCMIVSSS